MDKIRIGTRGSKLALWQANAVKKLVKKAFPDIEIEIIKIKSTGDKDRSTPLAGMGNAGVFVKELEEELLEKNIDLAIHSAKDMPSSVPEGLVVFNTLKREQIEDVLVSSSGKLLDKLRPGAVIGTSSPRRKAQLLNFRNDLKVKPIRGNVETRIKKVKDGKYDSTILARAGLIRLGLESEITEILDSDHFLPAPGQGIIAVENRVEDYLMMRWMHTWCDQISQVELFAERSFMKTLQSGCNAAVAGIAKYDPNNKHIRMTGRVYSLDGSKMIESSSTGSTEEGTVADIGKKVAEELLENGARELLDEIPAD